jgi:DNA-binding CsgD family transcriptional regulator
MNKNDPILLYSTDTRYLLKILEKIPAIAYTYSFKEAAAIRCDWSSLYTQHFLGLTQVEIEKMGFDFFKQTLHPDDLETIQKSLHPFIQEPDKELFTFIHRMKPIKAKDFIWLYGHSVVLEQQEDGTPKSLLNVSFEISSKMDTQGQLSEALKEIGRQQHHLQWESLTKRENEVLCCIANGLTDKQIARHLFISESTAKTHRNKILKKLKMKNSASLAAFAGECRVNG